MRAVEKGGVALFSSTWTVHVTSTSTVRRCLSEIFFIGTFQDSTAAVQYIHTTARVDGKLHPTGSVGPLLN